MKKVQNILTLIIVLSTLALVTIIGSIVYEERIKENKKSVESITVPKVEEDDENEDIDSDESEESIEEQEQEPEEYVGEEEQETQEEEKPTQTKDEKAIELAKDKWGDDNSVTFSVEEKKDTKYYVAVKREATVIAWYEVNTENWKISEY